MEDIDLAIFSDQIGDHSDVEDGKLLMLYITPISVGKGALLDHGAFESFLNTFAPVKHVGSSAEAGNSRFRSNLLNKTKTKKKPSKL